MPHAGGRGHDPGRGARVGAAVHRLHEGTANFVAPATERSEAEADSVARVGARIVSQRREVTSSRFDRDSAQALLDRGTSGGGPFYWLGAAMSRLIAERLGADSLAATLRSDGVAFVETYLRALGRSPGAARYLSNDDVAAVTRLRGSGTNGG